MTRILLFLLSAAVMVHAQLRSLTTITPNEVEPNAQCTSSGFMCKNCNQVAACILNPGGILTQIDVMSCHGSCRNGSCVDGAVCNYRPFTCSLGETGGFPDPYECTKFHICDGISSTPITKTCPADRLTGRPSAYGSESNSCGYPVIGNPNCINGPIPRCQQNLEVGVLEYDPNLYYFCTLKGDSLGHNLYRCSPGLSFNNSTFICS